MKKTVIMIGALAVMFVCITPSYALLRSDVSVSKGRVQAVDSSKRTITVRDDDTGTDRVYVVPAQQFSPALKGHVVVVVCNAGSNVVRAIRLVKPRP